MQSLGILMGLFPFFRLAVFIIAHLLKKSTVFSYPIFDVDDPSSWYLAAASSIRPMNLICSRSGSFWKCCRSSFSFSVRLFVSGFSFPVINHSIVIFRKSQMRNMNSDPGSVSLVLHVYITDLFTPK